MGQKKKHIIIYNSDKAVGAYTMFLLPPPPPPLWRFRPFEDHGLPDLFPPALCLYCR